MMILLRFYRKHIHFLLRHGNYVLAFMQAVCIYGNTIFLNNYLSIISIVFLFPLTILWPPLAHSYYLDQNKSNILSLRKLTYIKMFLGFSLIIVFLFEQFGQDSFINLLYLFYALVVVFTLYQMDKNLYQKYHEIIN